MRFACPHCKTASVEALAREADCTHVDFDGNRAKTLERLSEFAALVRAGGVKGDGNGRTAFSERLRTLRCESHRVRMGFKGRRALFKGRTLSLTPGVKGMRSD
jgi:hypothetical protein